MALRIEDWRARLLRMCWNLDFENHLNHQRRSVRPESPPNCMKRGSSDPVLQSTSRELLPHQLGQQNNQGVDQYNLTNQINRRFMANSTGVSTASASSPLVHALRKPYMYV